MRLRLAASLTYRYTGEATHARVQARLSPAATARQIVLVHPLAAEPSGWQLAHDDYWGTRVVEIEVSDPHKKFSVALLADVNLTGLGGKARADDFTRLDAPGVTDSFSEFLRPTPSTSPTDADLALARDARASADTPADLVATLSEIARAGGADDPHTHDDVTTHRLLGALRAVGVPARFVSGYRAPDEGFDPGVAATGVITSWLDYWDGAWQGWDAALVRPVGDRHVIIGWGRDRSDAPPLRGVYRGPDEAECTVDVQMTRLA